MLDKLLKFTDFTNQFRNIQRKMLATGQDRDENYLEHTGQLALLAFYLISTLKLDLNLEKVLKYALVHDLVETHAGDVYVYTKDQTERDSKEEKERKALERIKNEFPEFGDLYTTIHSYEKRQEREAKFVYALDKIVPMMNILLDNGRTWKREKSTLKMLRENKTDKVSKDPIIKEIYDELMEKLEENERELFSAKNPKLIILCGLPYSGKTTLTNKILERRKIFVGSVDREINQQGFEVDEMTQDDWNKVYSDAYEKVKGKLKDGENVIFDMGHLKFSERETARNIAYSCDAEPILIYINVSESEIWKRWKRNEIEKTRGQLSEKSLKFAISLWEEPNMEESPIVTDSSTEIGDILTKINL